jgi:amidophosphoribosyltransferase
MYFFIFFLYECLYDYNIGGSGCSAEAQPLYTNAPFGIALAHNGNLTNTEELAVSMKQERRHINTNSDSELLLNVFAEELQRRRLQEVTQDDVFDVVRSVMRRCKGGYAVVMLINRVGLVAFRDPHGIRPLCYGMRQTPTGTDYAVASESVAIDALDSQFKLARDVAAGEAIFISLKGELFTSMVHSSPVLTPCMFEYVYFARPDSVMDGVPVYEARLKMGEILAKKIMKQNPDYDIDIVMPIPETSRTSALQVAITLQKPYREGFVKNRYIARTFIMPGQEMRRKTVRLKLNTIKSEFAGKNVLLIDDSIVRGTTSMELVQMAREAGAKKVFFASAAPPVRFSNVYGIDIPTRTELIAHNRTEAEIAAVLGCDGVIYNDLEDIVEAVKSCNPTAIKDFDTSCFSGIRSFIFPVVMSILDYVCVFKRETIQRVDFVTHML